jgi:hypothetical protein
MAFSHNEKGIVSRLQIFAQLMNLLHDCKIKLGSLLGFVPEVKHILTPDWMITYGQPIKVK